VIDKEGDFSPFPHRCSDTGSIHCVVRKSHADSNAQRKSKRPKTHGFRKPGFLEWTTRAGLSDTAVPGQPIVPLYWVGVGLHSMIPGCACRTGENKKQQQRENWS